MAAAATSARVIIVSAANDAYFPLLQGLVESLEVAYRDGDRALGILDLGLTSDQISWLKERHAAVIRPEWNVDFPQREQIPEHYKAMTARPYLPHYFPGHETYLWLDADTWVQDGSVLDWFVGAAQAGKLAIVPEMDRGYFTSYKAPRLWGQNQKAFAWSYGLRVGYRLGRNPILNVGAFALSRDAPHWRAWAEAHRDALNRRAWRRRIGADNFWFFLSEQTALNKVIFGDRLPATFLPALANWFCAKGAPWWDAKRNLLVEPHMPHHPLGIVHLAGKIAKERAWTLSTTDGGTVQMPLTYRGVLESKRAVAMAERQD